MVNRMNSRWPMQRPFWVCLCFCSLWLAPQAHSSPPVAISEIMYHPVEEPAFDTNGLPVMDLYEELHEFVELHNYGVELLSLRGWQVTGGISFQFPAHAQILPGEYLVIAKSPAHLAAVKEYGLALTKLWGPWQGQLSNEGETLRLLDADGQRVDEVKYSAFFPWAMCANALGADIEWTGLNPRDHQYRGRSLERVSGAHSGQDSANWLASPMPGEPSPGRANAIQLDCPQPVVAALDVCQADNGQRLIRANRPVRLECIFSAAHSLSRVSVEYFVDNLDLTNEVHTQVAMGAAGQPGEGRFLIELPGQPDRSLVRYRIHTDRGQGDEVVSPRIDDPISWHAYFVAPVRSSSNVIYDLFISTKSLTTLRTNISQNPKTITLPDPPGNPRPSWNATEPAVLVCDGIVYDVRVRYHGSRYLRAAGRNSYKVDFPRFHPYNNRHSILLSDKVAFATAAGHALFREAGLPTSLTRWADLYVNKNSKLLRLEQEVCDGDLLSRYHQEQQLLHPEQGLDEPGDIFKAEGIFGGAEGPYGPADGRQLPARLPYWTTLQRYEWNFGLQNHDWRGHTYFKDMLDQMWVARNGKTSAPTTNEITKLRAYAAKYWDIDKTLSYLALINWMGAWDDNIHNYFLWQQRNGLWSMMPWDFDNLMTDSNASIFQGGTSYFKQSLVAAFRAEYKKRMWWLINTTLHADNVAAVLGASSPAASFAKSRNANVNTQCGLGTFARPNKPVNLWPTLRQYAGPFTSLQTSPYTYSTNPAEAHLSTTWSIRLTNSAYSAPVFQTTSTYELTNLTLPIAFLKPGETYYWRCSYTALNGHPSLPSAESVFTYGCHPMPTNGIQLNEILASHLSRPSPDLDLADWIELYNSSDQSCSLDGLSLSDNLMLPDKFVFPSNIVIQAHGYLVVWCDKEVNKPGLHTGFALAAAGNTLALFGTTTNGWRLQDLAVYGLQLPGFSIGRISVGQTHWTLTIPTPGTANQSQTLGSSASLKINEWMAQPVAGDAWLEIYNPDPQPVALGGLALTDDLRQSTNSLIKPLSFIAANGFARFVADAHPEKSADHTAFQLNPQSNALGLYATNAIRIDAVLFAPQPLGCAQGRLPDGAPSIFAYYNGATPGTSNNTDVNGNGLPDLWEWVYGLNPDEKDAAFLDLDGDNLNNLSEYIAGTNPLDQHDALRLEAASVNMADSRTLMLTFTAQSGRNYALEYQDSLGGGYWQVLTNVTAQPCFRNVRLFDAMNSSSIRYYRLVTPAPK